MVISNLLQATSRSTKLKLPVNNFGTMQASFQTATQKVGNLLRFGIACEGCDAKSEQPVARTERTLAILPGNVWREFVPTVVEVSGEQLRITIPDWRLFPHGRGSSRQARISPRFCPPKSVSFAGWLGGPACFKPGAEGPRNLGVMFSGAERSNFIKVGAGVSCASHPA